MPFRTVTKEEIETELNELLTAHPELAKESQKIDRKYEFRKKMLEAKECRSVSVALKGIKNYLFM